MRAKRDRRTAGAWVVGLTVVLGVVGCGGDRSTDEADVATERRERPAAVFDPPVTGGGDRVYATEVVRDVQEGFMVDSPGSVCFELSDAAKRRLLGSGGRSPRTCEEAVEAALKRWRAAGEEPIVSKVEGVEVKGDEALVTLDVPGLGRRKVRVVKEDSWDLPILLLDHPPGFELLGEDRRL